MKALRSTLLACCLLACQGQGRDSHLPESPAAEIPIRRVVLYQNGVGYFERQGKVEGGRLTLQIRPSQINDLLKSLTVIDKGSGRAVSISLPLEKSGDRVLAELPDQVRDANGLLDVLSVFRGARVELGGREGRVSGRVLGVENLEVKRDDDVVADWRVTIRSDSGELRVYPIRDITTVTILDRTLAVGLEQSLDVSLSQGDWKPITLSVHLAGDEKHDLQASYIVEMPRWKPAYRLVLGGPRPLLQGWAVVDNVSGEDWSDVKLSLVAGAPLSFIYDLHSSQYTTRVDMSPKGRQVAAAPPVEHGGVEEAPEEELADAEMAAEYDMDEGAGGLGLSGSGSARRAKSMAKPQPARAPAPMAVERKQMDDSLQEQAAPTVEIAQMGSLFRYDIADPVTVPDRSSTLVAIINERVSAEEVLFFRPDDNGQLGTHPYRSMKFTNDTALTLEKGPVTLYSGGTFVGEGFVDQVQPGSTHFISYSIDGRVSLNSDIDIQEEDARILRVTGGQVVSEALRTVRTKYTIENLNDEPIKAYLKEERRANWELQSPPPGIVETPTDLMIPADVPAKKKSTLEVAWTSKNERTIGLDTSSGLTLLRVYVRGGKVPAQAKEAVDKVLAVKDELDQVSEEAGRVHKLHDQLSRDQDRVRANLDTLRKTKGNQQLQASLAKKLASQEEELGKLSGRLVEFSERDAELRAQLKELIKAVTFEPKG